MKNKLGMYYGYFVQSPEYHWEDYARRSAAAGAKCIEMSALALLKETSQRRREIRQLLDDLDMELSFATALRPEGDFSSDSPAVRAQAVEDLKVQIDMAAEMKVRKIGGIMNTLGKKFPKGIAFKRKRYLENAVEPMRKAGEYAASRGITIGQEIVNRFESPLLNTVDEGIAFLKMIGSSGVKLHIDTFHMNIEEDDPIAAVLKAKDYLCHVHFCENNRRLPGLGHVDFQGILRALNTIGYQDTIIIESLARPYGDFSDRLNIWRNLEHTDMDEDMKHSLDYLYALEALV